MPFWLWFADFPRQTWPFGPCWTRSKSLCLLRTQFKRGEEGNVQGLDFEWSSVEEFIACSWRKYDVLASCQLPNQDGIGQSCSSGGWGGDERGVADLEHYFLANCLEHDSLLGNEVQFPPDVKCNHVNELLPRWSWSSNGKGRSYWVGSAEFPENWLIWCSHCDDVVHFEDFIVFLNKQKEPLHSNGLGFELLGDCWGLWNHSCPEWFWSELRSSASLSLQSEPSALWFWSWSGLTKESQGVFSTFLNHSRQISMEFQARNSKTNPKPLLKSSLNQTSAPSMQVQSSFMNAPSIVIQAKSVVTSFLKAHGCSSLMAIPTKLSSMRVVAIS